MKELIFPSARTDPSHPPAAYVHDPSCRPRRTRLAYGGEAWLVTSFHDARQVLADSAFSSDSSRTDYPNFPLALRTRVPGHFVSMDAPEHTRLRKVVAAGFSPSGVKAIEPFIVALAGQFLAAARRNGSFDLVSDVAVPLHGGVVAELLGVPAAGQELFGACTRRLQRHDASAASRMTANVKLTRYLTDLLASPETRGRDNLIGVLARTRDSGALTGDEAVAIANLILVAGLETTVGLLALTVYSLLRDRRQWDLLRGDPGRWAGPAVREALRYWTLVQHGVTRVATREVVVGGEVLRAGDAVVVHLPTANRDPSVYASPDTFDIAREAAGHLAFGHGAHHCLGAVLAQVEVTTAITALARQLPGLALATPEHELSFLHHMLIYGLRDLVLTWPTEAQEGAGT